MNTADFRSLGGEGYVLDLPECQTVLRLERLRRERGQLLGELTVASTLPAIPSVDGVVHVADFNLSSDRARSERARILAERTKGMGFDWSSHLERLCQLVLAAERAGEPAVLLRDLPPRGDDGFIEVDRGIYLLRHHPTIVFGDGGDAKSYLALYWAGRLCQLGLRVLYADWEFAGEDHRDRLGRLFGPDMPDVLYARCERPLTVEVDRLCGIIREQRIDYVVCDSVAYACDGPPEAAEVAAAYFRAVRRFRTGSLHIAHTSKGEGNDRKPFGSTFWHNSARATLYVKRATDTLPGWPLMIGLYNRKANTAALASAAGYEITFEPDRTTFRRSEVRGAADNSGRMPVSRRIEELLRSGSLTVVEIAEQLDTAVDTVRKTVDRGDGKIFVKFPGPDGILRVGLAAEVAR